MRLLISLFKYFPFGGLQKDTLRFAREAARRGHQVDLLVTAWQGERPTDANLTVHFTPPIRAWTNTARMDEFARRVEEFRRQQDYDVTLAMNRIPGADFYFAADACMKHYLKQAHWAITLALSPRYRAILRQEEAVFSPQSHTRIFTIADAQVREFQEEYGTQSARFFPLPPGMDEACLPPPAETARKLRQSTRQELGLNDADKLLLLVGTSFYNKGADRVLTALAALPSSLRDRVHFAMIGNSPAKTINHFARKLGLPLRSIHPIPPREHVAELLLAADLMVHPARSEGAGAVLVEALANGLPVICTEDCGFSPYVADAGCPVIPSPFRQSALNQTLAETLPRLPALRESINAYAATQDFCARSRVAIETLESFIAK
ncbi:MAG: glycosyltransferase family 4 protein [Victivallales bacterium]|nr:glycosyltransferase family 4 protein [Victivallales bacterium]